MHLVQHFSIQDIAILSEQTDASNDTNLCSEPVAKGRGADVWDSARHDWNMAESATQWPRRLASTQWMAIETDLSYQCPYINAQFYL